jgi:hypothetical protein
MSLDITALNEQKRILFYMLENFNTEVSQNSLQETIITFLVYSSFYSNSEKKKEERRLMFNKKELEILEKIEALLLSINYDGFILKEKDKEILLNYKNQVLKKGSPPRE